MRTLNSSFYTQKNTEHGLGIIEAMIGMFLIVVMAMGVMEAAKQSGSQVQNIELLGARDRVLQKIQNAVISNGFFNNSLQSPTGFAPSGTNDDFKKCLTGKTTTTVIANGCTANTVFPISLYDANGSIIANGSSGTFYGNNALPCSAQSTACPIKVEANFKATCNNATTTCTQANSAEITFKVSAPSLNSISSIVNLNSGNSLTTGSITGGKCPPNRVMRGIQANGMPNCWSWIGNVQGTVFFGYMFSSDLHTTTLDSQGNLYAAGTAGTTSNYGSASAGSSDVYLQKYDNQGNLIWQTQFGSSSGDTGPSNPNQIVIDTSGNIYIAGTTAGAMPGNVNAGNIDVFIAKFNSSGNRLWISQFGSSGTDNISSITLDSSNNIIVAGTAMGSLPGNTNAGGQNVYLAKYDTNGNQLWIRQFGSNSAGYPISTRIDSNNNIYFAGTSQGTLPGNVSSGGYDFFVAKYDPSGTQVFISQFGSASDDISSTLTLDSSGNIYVGGATNGVTNVAEIAKLNSGGSLQWIQQFSGSVAFYAVTNTVLDNSGNIIIAGTTTGAFTGFSNGGGTDMFGNPYSDVYFTKYNSSGAQQWVKQFGTAGADVPTVLLSDGSGNIYIFGTVGGNDVLGMPSPGGTLPGNTGIGGADIFIGKYDNSGNGNKIYLKQYGTTYDDSLDNATFDVTNSFIYISGSTYGSLNNLKLYDKNNASFNSENDPYTMKFEAATGR